MSNQFFTYPFSITVYQRDQTGQPQFFLLRKIVKAAAGTIITREYSVGTPSQVYKIQLPEQNVLEVLEVRDSDNNIWYEVPYLAQDLILLDEENIEKIEKYF